MQITPVSYNYMNYRVQKNNSQQSFTGEGSQLRAALLKINGLTPSNLDEITGMTDHLKPNEIIAAATTAASQGMDSLAITKVVGRLRDNRIKEALPLLDE